MADGKEHGFGIKFWPIVVEPKVDENVENSTEGGDVSEDGEIGEQTERDANQPKKETKPTIEYDSYEGMWKDGWEHGVGKYTWYHLLERFCERCLVPTS